MSGPVTRHGVLLAVVWMLAVVLLQLEPLNDVDIYWQVRLGQLMLDQGHLVTADPFTFTHPEAAVPCVGWLAQIIFASLYNLSSWRGVQIAHVVLFAGAFWVAGRSAVDGASREPRGLGLFSLLCALFLGFIAGGSNSMVRPQSFGIFCFAVLLYVVQSNWRFRSRALLLLPLLLIWQNTHPSVLIGGGAVAALAGAHWLDRLRGSRSAAPWGITGIVVLVALAQFATPMGWRILETSAANVHVARDLLGVSEWMPPWDPSVRGAMVGFGLAAAITIGLLIRLRFRVRLEDAALCAALALLSLTAARFVLFWAVAMVPVWSRWIEQSKPDGVFGWQGDRPVGRIRSALLTGFGVPLALVLPSLLQGGVVDEFALGAGITRLREVTPHGRIYNYREWGGPLILAGHPDWQVAIDGRLYLFGEEHWHAYHEAAMGRVAPDDLARRYDVDAFFLHPSYHHRLIEQLRAAGTWREVHADDYCVIFSPANRAGN
jgi:hypothetical protein